MFKLVQILLIGIAIQLSALSLRAQSFSLSLSPASQSVTSGQVADFIVNISASGGFQYTVYLSATSTSPCYFSNNQVNYPYAPVHFYVKPLAGDTGWKNFTVIGKNTSINASVSGTLHSVLNAQWQTMTHPEWGQNTRLFASCDQQKNFSAITIRSNNPISYSYASHKWQSTALAGTKCTIEECKGAYAPNADIWFLDYCGVNRLSNGFLTTYTSANSSIGSGLPLWIDMNREGKAVCRLTDKFYQYDAGSTWHEIASVNTLGLGGKAKFVIDSSGDIVSYNESAAMMYKISGGIRTYFSSSKVYDVRDLIVAPDSSVWGITSDATNNVFHITGTAMSLMTIPSASAEDKFNAISVDARGHVWIAATSGVYQYYAGSWSLFSAQNSPLNDGEYLDLVVDGVGNLWIVGLDKLYVYNPDGLSGIPLTASSVENATDSDPTVSPISIVQSSLQIKAQSTLVIIYDCLGNCVKSFNSEQGQDYCISTTSLANGFYFLRDGDTVRSFVVSK